MSEILGERYAYPKIEEGFVDNRTSVPGLLAYEIDGKRVKPGTLTLIIGQRAPYERTNEYLLQDVVSIELLCGEAEVWSTPLTDTVSGAVAKGTTVTILPPQRGARIYYTLNAKKPTLESETFDLSYLSWGNMVPAFLIEEDTTIKAITVGAGKRASAIAVYTYIVGEEQFCDLEGVSLEKGSIYALSKYGVINGIEPGIFEPEGCVTRAQAAKMIVQALGYNESENVSVTQFSDISPDTWYAPYVSYAIEEGYINENIMAKLDGSFYVTRAQAADMIYRALY